MKIISRTALVIISAFILSSCTGVPVKPTVPQTSLPPHPVSTIPQMPGQVIRHDVVHVVAPGETVWRISRMYDVSMDDIVRANNLSSAGEIFKGQRLNIPRAAPIKPVVTLYPSKKWKYIIIHHSATEEGNALGFDRSHEQRGFTNGLGYDFVIDNGTQGKPDGNIETSPRWIKQQDGAHCRADSMNCRAIGICLVGNFDKERVSKKQMDSLVYLVKLLQKYYKIPADHIMGHGQVRGANTHCPGKNFPWNEFRSKI